MWPVPAEDLPGNEVVVTGYGLVSPIGIGARDFEEGLFHARSGVIAIRGRLVPENFPVPYAAWIPRERLPPSRLFAGDASALKAWLMAEQATEQALEHLSSAGGPHPAQPHDQPHDQPQAQSRAQIDAIVFGTADGVSFEIAEAQMPSSGPALFKPEQVRSESSLNVVRDVVARHGFAPVKEHSLISLNGACATGNQTLGVAMHGIRAGRWTRCLVGGVDARCEASNLLNFHLLGALCSEEVPPEQASRPFSRDRSGFVRGEGAAVLVLESREAAVARGARIHGVVSGYACTGDAYRLTDGREDGDSVVRCMEEAIRDAGLTPSDIDYVNAHGTATEQNDRLETAAIKRVFGARAYRLPISSLKSQIGHSTIAAGSLEAVACLMMLERQRLAPTLNYRHPDPACDLDYVPNVSRSAELRHVLSNNFGFGGQNACVVFSKADLR